MGKKHRKLLLSFMTAAALTAALPTTLYAQDTTSTVYKAPKERTYTVRHIRQSADGTYNDEALTEYETLNGNVGEYTKASVRDYEGFQALEPKQVKIAQNGDITVSVYYARKSYTVYFDTGVQGKEFNETYLYGTMQSAPPTPEVPGKTFQYWSYKDDSGNWQHWTPGIQPAKDVTVYANYDPPLEATYKINYWYQAATDELSYDDSQKTYLMFDSETKTQTVYSDITLDGSKYESTYRKYNKNKTEEVNKGKIVESDGSTVINIYYDRPEMTITFIYYNPDTGEEDHRESFSAVYGHLTSGIVSYDPRYLFYSREGIGPKYKFSSLFEELGSYMSDDYHVEYHARKLEEEPISESVMVFHFQSPDGTWKHEIYKTASVKNGKTEYRRFVSGALAYPAYYYWTDSADEFTTDVSESNKDLHAYHDKDNIYIYEDGKLINDYDGDGKSYLHIYWKRQAYNLKFDGTDNDDVSLLNGAPLSYVNDTINNPVRPQSVPDDYIFAGWYLTPDLSEGTELNSDNYVMPMQDMTIYAKWQPQDVTVTVEGNGADSKLPDSVKIHKNYTVHRELSMIPEKKGYWFGGWYKYPEFNTPFDINEKIEQDTVVYAKWDKQKSADWRVRYLDADGNAVSDEESGSGDINDVIYKDARNISGYIPDYASKNLTLASEGEANVLDFIYHRAQENGQGNMHDDTSGSEEIELKSSKGSNDNSPKTGDNTMTALYVSLSVGSVIAAGIVFFCIFQKKKY